MKEILEKYQVRKTNKQKTNFINYIIGRLTKSEYRDEDIKIEERWKGPLRTRNIVVGNPDKAEIIVTAHYDTPPVSPIPNAMFPTNVLMFVLFQILFCFIIILFAWVITIPIALSSLSGEFYVNSMQFIFIGIFLWFALGYQNKHNANDNTSGVITLVKILEEIPKENRDKICVVFFDNEEKGLFGSLYFKKLHPSAQNKLVVNFDCVGDGDRIVTLARKKARNNKQYKKLTEIFSETSKKYNMIYLKKNAKPMTFGSDQMNFDISMAVCTLRKSPLGFLYAARIHTPFDKTCEERNLDCLAEVIIEYIGG